MKVVVIGGGASGMLAAAEAARNLHNVTLLEQNEKLGKKVYISGKGRCNLTNDADQDGFFAHITHNPRFLYSAFAAFDNRDIMRIVEDQHVKLKVERGGRVFPESDKSSDILKALERYVRDSGVYIRFNTKVTDIKIQDGQVKGVITDSGEVEADAVIIATGGVSYPQCGSTGDGYKFAKTAGHTVLEPKATLVGLNTVENWPFELTGLTLKNVGVRAYREKKKIYDEQGEMLLTHFGVSGPLILSLSSVIADSPEGVRIEVDFKPALDEQQLDTRLVRDIDENRKKSIKGAFHALLPERLLETVLEQAGIQGDEPVDSFKKEDRRKLGNMLKAMPLTVKSARPVEEAIVTRGGVNIREVNSSTMESKLVKNLYFAGEVLDVDALTGGYNLQIAWSTGALAGRSIENG